VRDVNAESRANAKNINQFEDGRLRFLRRVRAVGTSMFGLELDSYNHAACRG
jgi:hypothetical protein